MILAFRIKNKDIKEIEINVFKIKLKTKDKTTENFFVKLNGFEKIISIELIIITIEKIKTRVPKINPSKIETPKKKHKIKDIIKQIRNILKK